MARDPGHSTGAPERRAARAVHRSHRMPGDRDRRDAWVRGGQPRSPALRHHSPLLLLARQQEMDEARGSPRPEHGHELGSIQRGRPGRPSHVVLAVPRLERTRRGPAAPLQQPCTGGAMNRRTASLVLVTLALVCLVAPAAKAMRTGTVRLYPLQTASCNQASPSPAVKRVLATTKTRAKACPQLQPTSPSLREDEEYALAKPVVGW